jgi:HlyD family secretion protein
MKALSYFLCPLTMSWLTACGPSQPTFDASGTFEAQETLISSQATGVLRQFWVEEGRQLKSGEPVGYVDSLQLFLHKKQLQAQVSALLSRRPNVALQLATLQEQLRAAEGEKRRIENLLKADAATAKQLDDMQAQVEVIRRQIDAQRSNLDISLEGISKDVMPLQVQIEQLNDQLERCKLVNPIQGTVLSTYARQEEMTTAGKALYKIADLSTLILRAYISGRQLPQVKLGQQVRVLTDDGKGGMKESKGSITWVSNKAEFTPKTIQTKGERANLVYALKVKVPNDGTYKIGMYGEINFQ